MPNYDQRMKVIVTTGTDHTNVYQYLRLYVINPDGTEGDFEKLPAPIRALTREQHNTDVPEEEVDKVAEKLMALGWLVLTEDCEPWFQMDADKFWKKEKEENEND